MVLEKKYNPRKIESKWSKIWLDSGLYKFNSTLKKPIYSIDTPPPTVSGNLHMGHVYGYVQQDYTARYRRMNGFNVFYPFGFDDNGIATERLVEKKTKKSPQELGRKKFCELCSTVTKKMENEMKKMWIQLGLSPDWSRLYRTIDPEIWKISQISFIDLYKMGREYQKEGPTFWCPTCSTAVSQVELEDKEIESQFNDIIFKLEDGKDLIISTTRPELLPACVCIFVHPNDKKYAHLVGKKAKVPLFNFEVPIKSDERVELDKGTGVVMCCTFGDQTDVDWFYAYNLPLRVAINETGHMTALAGKYDGLHIKEARKQIIHDLKKSNLLSSQKKIKHMVNTHERCGTEIEFLVSKQWFIKYLDLKDEFLKAGNAMNWYPKYMKNRYDNWIKGLQWDWCISRQRYNGIPFPVWYCKDCGEIILADKKNLPVDPLVDKPKKPCPKCGSTKFIPEEDVLDTWATSSLTPLINAGWDGEKYDKKLFPTTLRPQGHDIVTFWLFNTVAKSLMHYNKIPFTDITINGWILDEKGKKMSKSRENIIHPLDIMKKYSCDAIRFWCAGAKLGEDLPFRDKDLVTGERFLNKIWNASRFSSNFITEKPKKPVQLALIDQWMFIKTDKLLKEVTRTFNKYEYSKIRANIREVFWHLFCDNYVELAKSRLYSKTDQSSLFTLYHVLKKFENDKSITVSVWPKPLNLISKEKEEEIEKLGDRAIEIIGSLRKFKAKNNLSLNQELKKITLFTKEDLKPIRGTLKEAMQIKELIFNKNTPEIKEELIEVKANFAELGPRYGSKVKDIVKKLSQVKNLTLDGEKIILELCGEKITLRGNEIYIKKKMRFNLPGKLLKTDNELLLIEI